MKLTAMVLGVYFVLLSTLAAAQTFKIDSNYLSKKAFTVFTNRTFGQIATGQNTASLANFGAFDPSNGSFTLNAFTPLNFKGDTAKYVPLLSLELKGDLGSDNISQLFSSNRLNNNVDASIKFHFPLTSLFKIGFWGSHYTKLYEKKRRLQKEYELKLQLADSSFRNMARDTQSLQWGMNLISQKLIKERDTLRMYKDSIERLTVMAKPDTVAISKFTKGHLETRDQMAALFRDSMALQVKKDSLKDFHLTDAALLRNDWRLLRKDFVDTFADTLLKLELAAPVTRVRLCWFTLLGTFNQKKYWFYDETLAFEDRIKRIPFSGFSWGGEFNFYSQRIRSHHAHFATLGIKRKQENNIADFSTSTINQKTKSASGTTEREVVKSYSAYTDVITEYDAWFFYANYYLMFKYNNLSAIHFFPEIDTRTYKDGLKKAFKNLGVGYVFSVKDSKKEKSILNFEAYYKFLDMDNQNESEKKFFERNEIGVRIGFPLNFVLN